MGQIAQFLGAVAEQADLHRNTDRRARLQLFDGDARQAFAGQAAFQPAHDLFSAFAIGRVNQDLGIVVGPLFRDDRQPEARPARADKRRVRADMLALELVDLRDDLSGFSRGLTNRCAFRQIDVDRENVVAITRKEGGAHQRQTADAPDQNQQADAQADRSCDRDTTARTRCSSGRTSRLGHPRSGRLQNPSVPSGRSSRVAA